MKDYQLNTPPRPDPLMAHIEKVAVRAKATNEIVGLIRGILADGIVQKSEAEYLKSWIEDSPGILTDPLICVVYRSVVSILKHESVTQEDLDEIKKILSAYATGGSSPTTLPLDNPPPDIIIPGNSFCFTGVFNSGSRKWCKLQITMRGGFIHDDVCLETYALVIGSKVTASWANQTYGRKIEHVCDSRRRKICQTFIIAEDHWMKFLK